MKKFALLFGLAALLAVSSTVAAADKKAKKKQPPKKAQPQTWEEKKKARFKPITDEQRKSIASAVPKQATVKPKQARRILVFYRCGGFIHTSIPFANLAVQEMSRKTKAFAVDLADTYDVFTRENLKKYDLVLLNSTTHMKFENAAQEKALLDFVASGKGLAGFHAASDNFGDHPKCREMIGGQFNGHPWGAGGKWAFKLDDPKHVLNKAFGGKGFWHSDEIYQYNPDTYIGLEKLRVLVSLDMSKEAVTKPIEGKSNERYKKQYGDGPREVPVSWVQEIGKGRLFYTNLGHRDDTFWNPQVLRHMLDGLQYALGDLEADATPTAKIGKLKPALAPAKP